MRSHSCLRALRRTLEVSGLRTPLYAGDRVDGKPLDGWHQASFAGTLRSGRAGVPAAFPGTGQCSCDRALLSPGASLLCSCRGIAGPLRRTHRVRRDHNWRGSARQTRLGGRRQSHRIGDLQRNGQVKVFAVPAREGKRMIGLVRAHTSPAVSTTPTTGKHTVRCASRETTWWFGRSEADRKVEITSTGSKASGAMPKTGCIRSAEYPENTFIFFWGRFASALIIETRTSSLCFTRG